MTANAQEVAQRLLEELGPGPSLDAAFAEVGSAWEPEGRAGDGSRASDGERDNDSSVRLYPAVVLTGLR